MAWQANNPNPIPHHDSSFPGLTPTAAAATATKTEYHEIQENELLALEAIYGNDFVKHSNAPTAWKKADPSFDIHITASSDCEFAVTLSFVMTATYPKTPPLITLKATHGLREALQLKVTHFIQTQPKLYARDEQEMIDKIVEGVRELIEDAAQSKSSGTQPLSLEEERERHEADLAKLAMEQKQQQELKRQQEAKEEDRLAAEMLKQQIDHQRQRVKESRLNRQPHSMAPVKPTDNEESDFEKIDFDQLCITKDKNGNTFAFHSVSGKSDPRGGQVSVVYTVRPMLFSGQGSQTLALKEATLRCKGIEINEFKKQIQLLESRLQDLKTNKKIKHRHLVEVLDFKLEINAPTTSSFATEVWNLRVLTPLADKGSLEELLELAGHLEIDKLKSWTRDLLEALSYLHNRGITHRDIHPRNILLFRESTGEIIPKMSDAYYQREIHNTINRNHDLSGVTLAKSAYWLPPEIAGTSNPQYSHKSDIWDFGVVFVQMIFGLDVVKEYSSPKALVRSLTLSKPLRELVDRFFREEKQKRHRAFELGSSEFLATDAPVFAPSAALQASQLAAPARLRRESITHGAAISRYTEDFVEEGQLGKGGFGQVVKARKKLDGQIYAIKKITQRSQASLSAILKEVRLLSRISHPAVVRYYNTWVERESLDGPGERTGLENAANEGLDMGFHIQFTPLDAEHNNDLDFINNRSSIAYAESDTALECDDEDDEEDDEDDAEDSDSGESGESEQDSSRVPQEGEDDIQDAGNRKGRRRGHWHAESTESAQDDIDETSSDTGPSGQQLAAHQHEDVTRNQKTTLYISMEYCEKRTLRDLINSNVARDMPEVWRLFRQILEGLAHIHGLSIVHRDLKPENIFMSSSADNANNAKIGDFGLATGGLFSIDKVAANGLEVDSMTSSVGTASYQAPEVSSSVTETYSTKVDMYSLGLVFFEMCHAPMMGMEKAIIFKGLRSFQPVLPQDFRPGREVQSDMILSLVNHNAKERPSSSDLLKSGKLPVPLESETVRRTLAGLADPDSPYHSKMLNTLFARLPAATTDYVWDAGSVMPSAAELLQESTVKEVLTGIFRRHGALEASRSFIYPISDMYGPQVFKVLDANGTVLQLPFDLTLGNARMLAKKKPSVSRTFTFGNVFRDGPEGGQPDVISEVDFDIISDDALDLALREAEVLKVLDEIVVAFPSLNGQMCFQIGHSDLLQLILEYCGVQPENRRSVANALTHLNDQNRPWQKVKAELRSPATGVSATSINELQRFDFRDVPNKAFARLKALFEGSDMYQRASPVLAHLKEVMEYLKRFKLSSKVYINPLNSVKEHLFVGGILFCCMHDKKAMDVFAAGGRYDQLIRDQRPRIAGLPKEQHAVGFQLAWERLTKQPKPSGKHAAKKVDEDKGSIFAARRCDALVSSFDAKLLRSTGVEILELLWSHDMSAELAKDAKSPEELLARHRNDTYSWIIIIKQESMLKIKTMGRSDITDVDIPTGQLLTWLRPQVRERESRRMRGGSSQVEPTSSGVGDRDHEQEVRVLVAQTKSKKFNRQTVVEQAQMAAASVARAFLAGPILAVETTDNVMELMRGARVSEPESWRRVEQQVTTLERNYVRDVHRQLEQWRWAHVKDGGPRHSFIYNFRTGTCLYYDVGL
ncbi:hypothetical protein CDD82_1333 [Ophiocordyceps australis]|uniref:non-specific serine/threonine protein kinase n=1 Tax=Ophiocordyceps australis TaxID=1399860 RepID=A0A2C5Y692_9HYPO|nr:hypothetical protein CDD82_1333 [Ophiocordyceps australis]